jgi:outer membrane protein assembly factor BamE (lipoprotein component of BamABCDE complex)
MFARESQMQSLSKRAIKASCAATAALIAAFFAPAASAQAQSDGVIVRNERVGAVNLGDTPAEVFSVLGQPSESRFLGPQEGVIWYCGGECSSSNYRGLSLNTWGPQNEVFRISVSTGDYATSEGVRVGISEMDVRMRLGNPSQRIWQDWAAAGEWNLHYPGLLIAIDQTGVTRIEICQPRYQRRGRAGRLWCY